MEPHLWGVQRRPTLERQLRFKGWLDRFNGVSSKFLDNYLVWVRFLDAHSRESTISKRDSILATACMTPKAETYQAIRKTTFAFPT